MNRCSDDPIGPSQPASANALQPSGLSDSSVLVMLCTYNEVNNVPLMVEQLHTVLPLAHILVVDDNSPDGTGAWVEERSKVDPQLHLLTRHEKLGLGSATRAGIEWCLSREFDFLLNLDADLSHPTCSAPDLLNACQAEEYDVAVGSRYIPGGASRGLNWYRRIVSRLLNSYATWMLDLPLTDCSGSYRCYRTSALRKLDITRLTCNGYGFLEELLVYLHRNGARFIEVPISFEERLTGESKLSFRDALGALAVIQRLRIGRNR